MEGLRLSRCPVCRARLSGNEPMDEPCPRCGSDLGWVRLACSEAARLRREARKALARQEVERSVDAAFRACCLVNCSETRRTLAAALLASHRVEQAMMVLVEELDEL